MKGAGMKLVYIASPLRGENPSGKDYKKNIEQAAKYCENACSLGVLAFAPHLYFTQFYNDTIPEQREKGLEMGLAMLEKCEELWVMGTHISQGMRGEIAHAKSLGIPIYNVEMPDDIMYYPVSADNHALLGQHSCMPDSRDKDYMGKILVMNYEALKPEKDTYTFEDVLHIIADSLKEQINKENLEKLLSYNVSNEVNFIIRAVPRVFKSIAMRRIYKASLKANTSTITNLGVVSVDDMYKEYIDRFHVVLSMSKGQFIKGSVISYKDTLVFTFSSAIRETFIQKEFFRQMVRDGIHVSIESNGVYYE